MSGFDSNTLREHGVRATSPAELARTVAGVAASALLLLALGGASVSEAPPTPGSAADEPPPVLQQPVAATVPALSPAHVALGEDVSRRYRVAGDAAQELVAAAVLAGQSTGIDPMLVLAVIAVESRFNPIAESDYGARGLMQVVARFHPEKLPGPNGARALLDPWTNVHVGTLILREYLDRTGSLESALQRYAGAADDPDRVYARKVLGEFERLRRVKDTANRGRAADRAL